MRYIFIRCYFFMCLGLAAPLCTMQISSDEATEIGKAIFQNECSGKADYLVWWNAGENFASLGIGHFIWYPQGVEGPFEETFPALLVFLKKHHVALPAWLSACKGCPWSSREAFLAGDTRKNDLQELLTRTMALQAIFIGSRFTVTMPKILSYVCIEKRARVGRQIARLEHSSQGKFALIDYLNFKGAGISEAEQYEGQGWGLRQVLEEMPECPADNSVAAFTAAAQTLLQRRVERAPPERHEERWLPGWLARVNRYGKS